MKGNCPSYGSLPDFDEIVTPQESPLIIFWLDPPPMLILTVIFKFGTPSRLSAWLHDDKTLISQFIRLMMTNNVNIKIYEKNTINLYKNSHIINGIVYSIPSFSMILNRLNDGYTNLILYEIWVKNLI